MFNTIFANDRIRPEDLCSRKQLIYLLSHNHCPQKSFYNICPFARLQRGRCQCDQIGRFLKFLATKFLPKEAQNNWQLLGYFEKPHSWKNDYFGGKFWKNWATFYSNIWSHWSSPWPPPPTSTSSSSSREETRLSDVSGFETNMSNNFKLCQLYRLCSGS